MRSDKWIVVIDGIAYAIEETHSHEPAVYRRVARGTFVHVTHEAREGYAIADLLAPSGSPKDGGTVVIRASLRPDPTDGTPLAIDSTATSIGKLRCDIGRTINGHSAVYERVQPDGVAFRLIDSVAQVRASVIASEVETYTGVLIIARRIPNAEIIAHVRAWQAAGFVHPLTCGNESEHPDLEPEERDGRVVLVCHAAGCPYVQSSIPPVVCSHYVEHFRSIPHAREW